MDTTRARVLCRLLIPVVAGAVFLSGCGGGAPAPQDTAQQGAQPPAVQAQPAPGTGQPAPAAAPAPATPPATAASAPPAGALVQEHESGVEVTLVELKRTSGDSVTAKWRYRNTTSADVKLSKGGSSWIDPYQLTAEAFLVDPVNKKKYLVITDEHKYPLASKHGDWQGVTLAPGQSLGSWAKFPAPPADVEKVAVTIAGVPPYEDVPIIK